MVLHVGSFFASTRFFFTYMLLGEKCHVRWRSFAWSRVDFYHSIDEGLLDLSLYLYLPVSNWTVGMVLT